MNIQTDNKKFGSEIQCCLNETKEANCSETQRGTVHEPAIEISDFSLQGGVSRCSGRLEFRLENSSVVGLCLGGSTFTVASLVCRELGCGAVSAIVAGSFYSGPPRPPWERKLECAASDQLKGCRQTSAACDGESLAVVCGAAEPRYRLGVGSGSCSGKISVFAGGSWLPVGGRVSGEWAEELCRGLRCGAAVSLEPASVLLQPLIEVSNHSCVSLPLGNESCSAPGPTTNGTTVYKLQCQAGLSPPFRLRGGRSRCEGKAEVYFRGFWRPVCRSRWTERERDVVCVQERCPGERGTWERDRAGGNSPNETDKCVECVNLRQRSLTQGTDLWTLTERWGTTQRMNITCPGLPEVTEGSSGSVAAWVTVLVLALLLVALACWWRRYRGRGLRVFQRKNTQRQWIGPTGATELEQEEAAGNLVPKQVLIWVIMHRILMKGQMQKMKMDNRKKQTYMRMWK
ncbi:scavenger receptor cysteine-rich type 1 protein M130-like [Amblyraja radiata]|uniref:scavenger receptor cysteine-rich type 1 protein M130-like n=1 Tax=Amblyraja radiata TaxID=386614 RepID=UPI001402DBB1|nr:scavenger receptor cysteine-rich type 1 protein M130-like [Amblyraja radiata]